MQRHASQGTLVRVTALADLLAAPDDDVCDALEHFIATVLYDAGVWSSVSDGVTPYRTVRTPAQVRVCGRIRSIDDHVPHTFWLDIERGDEITWTLYVDPDATALGARRARNILDLITEPREAPWVHTLAGTERRAP